MSGGAPLVVLRLDDLLALLTLTPKRKEAP